MANWIPGPLVAQLGEKVKSEFSGNLEPLQPPQKSIVLHGTIMGSLRFSPCLQPVSLYSTVFPRDTSSIVQL